MVFNGDCEVQWQAEGNSVLVNVEVGNRFESERVKKIGDALALLFNSIGRAHGRNIRV